MLESRLRTRYVGRVIRLVRRRIATFAAAATVLLVVPAVGVAANGLSGSVTLDGVGGVVPGMTAARVHTLWGIAVPSTGRACAVARIHVPTGNVNGYALFLHGRFAAVFFTSGATTPSGVRVGSTLGMLTSAYGRKLESEHGSHTYFLQRDRTPRWQVRFDVSKGRVTLIGFGSVAVHYVGGCGA
jgi:hypothetical protein